jgi:hypothetical protein
MPFDQRFHLDSKIYFKKTVLYNVLMHSSLEIIALIGAFILIVIYYKEAIKPFLVDPKLSFIYLLVIILMGYLFYVFFKSKEF